MASPPAPGDRLLGRRLSVRDVMDLYGIATPSAARHFMDEVGAFEVAGRLVVREAELLAHEDRKMAARRTQSGAPSSPSSGGSRRHTGRQNRGDGRSSAPGRWDHAALPPDFFEDSQTGSTPR